MQFRRTTVGLHLLAYLAVAGIADILALYKTSCTPQQRRQFFLHVNCMNQEYC